MSIITKYEILKYSPAKKYVSQDNICELAEIIEPDVLSDCFGTEFYEALKAATNDWKNVSGYVLGSTHALNDLVLFDGCVLISLEAANTETPTYNSTKWAAADKFTSAKFNDFWKNGGAMLVACSIILDDCVFQSYGFGANGLTKIAGLEGLVTISKDELFVYRQTIERLIYRIKNNLINWVKQKHLANTYDFTGVAFIDCDCLPCGQTENNDDRIAYGGGESSNQFC